MQQIGELLETAKKSRQLSVAFLSRLDGTTFCQAVLDGKLPEVIPDVTAFPQAMALPAARIPPIRSYVSVPVRLSDGPLYGTFCACGLTSDKELTVRDKALMEVLAGAAAVILEPGVREQQRVEEIRGRLDPVVAAGGPSVVLQPIVHLRTGCRVGAEALSRLPREWGRLAIDDVGAGFSSLRHIVLTAPDVLKLDRSLVTGLGEDPVLQTLVRPLTDFGHGSSARIVAEGVETRADAEMLHALEVDLGQGWYHGRPGPAADLAPCTPTVVPAPRPPEHDCTDSCNTA
jgi:hypothetical protein